MREIVLALPREFYSASISMAHSRYPTHLLSPHPNPPPTPTMHPKVRQTLLVYLNHSYNFAPRTSRTGAKYEQTILRVLKDTQFDDNLAGFYISTPLGTFMRTSWISMLANRFDALRQGGIALVHGASSVSIECAIDYDWCG